MTRAALLALGLLVLAPACGASGENGRPRGAPEQDAERRGAPARVTGTALDARTGVVLAGVRVEGPHGARAVSGRDGRFELLGLRQGDGGEVVGRLDDGRQGRVTLRPLSAERLEIVLRLAR
jgi:hypothetical protein